MKKILLLFGSVLIAVGLLSCAKETGSGGPTEQTTLEFSAFNTRSSDSGDDTDASSTESFRIIVFKTATGKVVCNTDKLIPTGESSFPYELTLEVSTYDFVFITNEGTLTTMLDSYTPVSDKIFSDFKNEVIGAEMIDFHWLGDSKSLIKIKIQEQVSVYQEGRYKLGNETWTKQGTWKVTIDRPYIRVDLNFFLSAEQAAEFEKGKYGTNDNNKIFFSGVPGGILFGGGVNNALPNTSDYTLHFKNASGVENFTVSSHGDTAYGADVTNVPGASGWKRYSVTVFLPENILTNKTSEDDAMRLNLVLDGVERSIPVYDLNTSGDYNLYRNHHYTYHCTVTNEMIRYSVAVSLWGEGDGTQFGENINQ